jgi:hypothetical protein
VQQPYVKGKEQDGQDGQLEDEILIETRQTLLSLLLSGKARQDTLKRDLAVQSEDNPGKRKQSDGESQGSLGSAPRVAEVVKEKNDDKVDDIVEHGNPADSRSFGV